MKPILHHLRTFAAALLALPLLSSCYFNSAGHIFAQAGYEAAVNPADLPQGSPIYTDGGDYYIELPRYMANGPVKTQYCIQQQQGSSTEPSKTESTSMVRISPEFANYLQGSGNYQPATTITGTGYDADEIKRRCRTLSTARWAQSEYYRFDYSSGGTAPLWYTLGIFDWLCIDLPMTLLENSLYATAMVLHGVQRIQEQNDNLNFTGPKSKPAGARTCEACAGNGKITFTNTGTRKKQQVNCPFCNGNGYFNSWNVPNYNQTLYARCEHCKGKGKALNTFLVNDACDYCDGTGSIPITPSELTTEWVTY